MGTTKWEAPSGPTTYETTDLNSLADGGNVLGDVISNDAAGELYMFADVELYLATTTSRGTDARVELYLLPTVDGSNYAYGGASLDPANNTHVGDFQLDASATAARYVVLRNILLPPEDFRFLIINEIGVAFASSGNTLKYLLYNIQT